MVLGLGLNPTTEARKADKVHHRATHFLAEVVSVTGNKITVTRIGQTASEGPYPAADGLAAAVSADDVVFVVDTNDEDGYLVLVKVTN